MTPPPGVAAYVRMCVRARVCASVTKSTQAGLYAPRFGNLQLRWAVRLTIRPRCFVSKAQTALLITTRAQCLAILVTQGEGARFGAAGHGEIRRDPPPVPGAEHRPYGLHLFQHLKRRGPLPLEKARGTGWRVLSVIHVTPVSELFFALFSPSARLELDAAFVKSRNTWRRAGILFVRFVSLAWLSPSYYPPPAPRFASGQPVSGPLWRARKNRLSQGIRQSQVRATMQS